MRADAQSFALASGSVDVAVSFETIEHFEGHDAFLRAMRAALTPDGILIISTPNPLPYSDTAEAQNPFHKRELDRDEFVNALHDHFSHVELLGQGLIAGSLITHGTGGEFVHEDDLYRVTKTTIAPSDGDSSRPLSPRYFLAVCSNGTPPPVDDDLMYDERETLYRDLLHHHANSLKVTPGHEWLTRQYAALQDEARRMGDEIATAQVVVRRYESEREAMQGEIGRAADEREATRREIQATRVRLHAEEQRADMMQRRLARTLALRGEGPSGEDRVPRALVVIPGGLNYFYDQAGERIAAALRNMGLRAEVATIRSAPSDRRYDWCFFVNVYEIMYGREDEALARIAALRKQAECSVAVLLECAATPWFAHSADACVRAGIATMLDLGFHDQRAILAAHFPLRYYFVFNGLTREERRDRRDPSSDTATARPIPWVLVGHLTESRARLSYRLVTEVDAGGVVYMPHIGPITEDGPHLNETQLLTVLARSRYQVWCSHHPFFYQESERFRQSLLAGTVPVKIVPVGQEVPDGIPFPYLLLPEATFPAALASLDFADTRLRFVREFDALPSLEEGLIDALMVIVRGYERGATHGQ